MARMTITILLLFILSVVNSKKIWEEAEDRWIEAKDDVREDWEKFKHDVEDNWDDVKDDWDGFVGDWKKAFKDVFHRGLPTTYDYNSMNKPFL